MTASAKLWPFHWGAAQEVSRVLLHLTESSDGEALIQFTVELAQRCEARVRGITLADAGALEAIAGCESAGSAVLELQRQQARIARQGTVRETFSQACLRAGIDFDLHRKNGRSLDALVGEAHFHDLSITTVSADGRRPGEFTPAQIVEAIRKGVSPLLVLRDARLLPRRILLVHDGSPAGNRTIRNFLSQRLFPAAQFRLIATDPSVDRAQLILRENLPYVSRHVSNLERGFLAGRAAQVVAHYAKDWDADLVVIGAHRRPAIERCLFGDAVRSVLKKTSCAVYSAD
jgi:nucleotide-binding universal stress UspA family protein